jgi:hypothetical protein
MPGVEISAILFNPQAQARRSIMPAIAGKAAKDKRAKRIEEKQFMFSIMAEFNRKGKPH